MKLLFIGHDARTVVSHRLNLVEGGRSAGHEVIVATPAGPHVQGIEAAGVRHEVIDIKRGGLNPIADLPGIRAIDRLLKNEKPDVVHCIASKPVIYGGLLARRRKIPAVLAISGLGTVFTNEGLKERVLRPLVTAGYGVAVGAPDAHVVFQNADDEAVFRSSGILKHDRVTQIPGSGTQVADFTPAPMTGTPMTFVLPARLLRDKGVYEFVEAAGMLKADDKPVRMVLLGDPDPLNPTSVDREQLAKWSAAGLVEWQPHTDDIAGALARCHVAVLPSYREGFPKSLIDAAAAGLAVAASDVPGCRDAVREGETGLLFPAREAGALAAVLRTLRDDPEMVKRMGVASRAMALERFDVANVTATHLALYEQMAR